MLVSSKSLQGMEAGPGQLPGLESLERPSGEVSCVVRTCHGGRVQESAVALGCSAWDSEVWGLWTRWPLWAPAPSGP